METSKFVQPGRRPRFPRAPIVHATPFSFAFNAAVLTQHRNGRAIVHYLSSSERNDEIEAMIQRC
jgi:hypothetical protein